MSEPKNYKKEQENYARKIKSCVLIFYKSDWNDDAGYLIRAAADALIKKANDEISSLLKKALDVDWDFEALDDMYKALEEKKF